jgi:hypothetical protein
MKNSTLMTLMAGTAMLLAAGAANAQPMGGHHGRGGPDGHRGGPGGGMEHGMMMLRAADADGDNSITRAEVDALQAEMFTWMDRTGDGYLDDADKSPVRRRMQAIIEAERAARGADGTGDQRGRGFRRQDGPAGGPEGRRRGPGGPGGDAMGMRGADADGDGRISRAEFLGAEHPGFARLDANSDGVITPDELDAAVDQRHSRRFWWRN